ncbi:DNA topoisomerase VI subunit B [Candidatus Woesearchaeota archaeon]|nr:DNA topoisomerase VI subunit B [Candidatus Woesearchaeota archaeon]
MGIADELAKQQRAVSIAEFFERNRHLLGFDNKKKALLTVVKEAVDNSLDACEEAKILPQITVELIHMGEDRYRVIIEDNGPGIVQEHIGRVFAKLLYGSKFHSQRQQRGQQGIGISAACLYAQLTTGRPAKITSKVEGKKARYCELRLDTKTNEPQLLAEREVDWDCEHGVRIELDLEAQYQGGSQSVDAYIKQTAIVNPHATIIYTNPKAEQLILTRVTQELPPQAKEIKPHPHGIEIGVMQKMLENTEHTTMQQFLMNDFCRVGAGTAKEILSNALIQVKAQPKSLRAQDIEQLMKGIAKTKIIAPPTDCIVPIGEELLEAGLQKEVTAEFYCSKTRTPEIYHGIPFVVEVALAYGGTQRGDNAVNVLRFANKVPLLYQMRSGAVYKSIVETGWRTYGLNQSTNQLPVGPLTIAVHLASVWPPFTSEAKEALANYPQIIKEIKLALQECGRKLGRYVNKKKKARAEQERVSVFEAYTPVCAELLSEITGESKVRIEQHMTQMLVKNKEFIMKNKGIPDGHEKEN